MANNHDTLTFRCMVCKKEFDMTAEDAALLDDLPPCIDNVTSIIQGNKTYCHGWTALKKVVTA